MLAKLRFPREALIAAGLLEVGLQFLIRTPLLAVAWMLSPDASVHTWWLMPGIFLGLLAAGTCIGILFLPMSMLYQDVAPAVALASGFWLMITPVGYAPPVGGWTAKLTAWNPASTLIETARDSWLGYSLDSIPAFIAITAGAALLAIAGWLAARVAFPHLIARFGS